jgi:hypothetical protein
MYRVKTNISLLTELLIRIRAASIDMSLLTERKPGTFRKWPSCEYHSAYRNTHKKESINDPVKKDESIT